jgi:translation initiation factor 2 subunit 1
MYKEKYPEVNQMVYVRVKNISDINAYVELLEYNNIEGMILLSQLTRKNRIRSISNYISVGKTDVMVVTSVDDNGVIDLSKRRITKEEIQECKEKYNKNNTVQGILKRVAIVNDVPLESLYQGFAWDLAEQYGSIYDAFQNIVEGEDVLGKYELDDKIQADLLQGISKSFTKKEVKIQADISLTCFTIEGVNSIKEALVSGSNEHKGINISLVSPPHYVVSTTTTDKKEGLLLVQQVCDKIEKVIVEKGGKFNVIKPPC